MVGYKSWQKPMMFKAYAIEVGGDGESYTFSKDSKIKKQPTKNIM